MSNIIEYRILTGSCKCDFLLFIYTFSNICNDKQEVFVILNIAKIATGTSKNLSKMLDTNVNDKASPFI